MALPPSTANWHWKNKNVTPWGTEWFENELTKISVKDDIEGEDVAITKVAEVEGDIELGQRKSKLIMIFDCRVNVEWSGHASDGAEVKGTATISEVSHETLCDRSSELVYHWILSSPPSDAANAILALAKSRLPEAIQSTLANFPTAMIETHGKDLTVGAHPSGTATPTPTSGVASVSSVSSPDLPSASPSSAAVQVGSKKARTKLANPNTSSLRVEATLQVAAEDLFELLTDAKSIPKWTRASAESDATVGGSYSLFNGGVRGKYVSLKRPTEIVQTWALQSPTWPLDHDAIMTIALDQSSTFHSTKITFSLSGVPVGMGDELKKNIEGYYIHGFKAIGYVQLIPARAVYPSQFLDGRVHASKSKSKSALIFAALVLLSAFAMSLRCLSA